MNSTLKRLTGVIMVLLAVASLLLSLYCLVQVWRLRQPLTEKALSAFDLVSTTLDTTEQGLTVVEGTLDNISLNVATLESATLGMAQSVHDAGLTVDSVALLVGEDLPSAITNTQNALSSAQTSALVIDNVLTALSRVPLIGIDYAPEIPLNLALSNIAVSLSGVPGALKNIEQNMVITGDNLVTLETQVTDISQKVKLINDNLTQAKSVVDQYQEEIAQFQELATSGRQSAPTWVTTAARFLTFLLIWLGISQLGLLVQGLQMFKA